MLNGKLLLSHMSITIEINSNLRGYSSRNIPNFRKCVYFKSYHNIPVGLHIAYYDCAKDKIEIRTPKMFFSRFKLILYV